MSEDGVLRVYYVKVMEKGDTKKFINTYPSKIF